MTSLFEQAFGTLDLYSVLQVTKDCSLSQLRKAYYKKAKQYHPDKNKNTDATYKFQAISWAYSFLKDSTKREEYNKDGIIPYDDGDYDDNTNEESKKSWKEYFDVIFGQLSTDDIDSFAEKYKMSDEEEKDVLTNYVKFKGNLKKMLGFVMLSEDRDVARWIEDYIQPAIERKEVENFEEMLKKTRVQVEKKMVDSNDKRKDNGNEEDSDETETEESEDDDVNDVEVKQSRDKNYKTVPRKKAKSTKIKAKSKQKNSEEALIAAIRNKNGRENPLASIADRYGVSSIDDDPLDDAQFEKMRSKYSSKKKK
mmetsp:Transcript_43450/g.48682  ORF Transcript_43450/g.48682 Transcript_43450/m.48682 type:complete len:310 (+) Transcript_43450:68-997(+)